MEFEFVQSTVFNSTRVASSSLVLHHFLVTLISTTSLSSMMTSGWSASRRNLMQLSMSGRFRMCLGAVGLRSPLFLK